MGGWPYPVGRWSRLDGGMVVVVAVPWLAIGVAAGLAEARHGHWRHARVVSALRPVRRVARAGASAGARTGAGRAGAGPGAWMSAGARNRQGRVRTRCGGTRRPAWPTGTRR